MSMVSCSEEYKPIDFFENSTTPEMELSNPKNSPNANNEKAQTQNSKFKEETDWNNIFVEGVTYYNNSDYVNAKKVFEYLKDNKINNTFVFYFLGEIYSLERYAKYQNAIESFEYFYQNTKLSKKDNAYIKSRIAEIYFAKLNNSDKGIENYEKSLLYTEDENIRNSILSFLAPLYVKRKEFDKAIQAYKEIDKYENLTNEQLENIEYIIQEFDKNNDCKNVPFLSSLIKKYQTNFNYTLQNCNKDQNKYENHHRTNLNTNVNQSNNSNINKRDNKLNLWFLFFLIYIIYQFFNDEKKVETTETNKKRHNILNHYLIDNSSKTKLDNQNIDKNLYNFVHEKYNYQCAKCGSKESLQIHHILPLSEGGQNNIDNLILLCHSCHQKEHPYKINQFNDNKVSLDMQGNFIRNVIMRKTKLSIINQAIKTNSLLKIKYKSFSGEITERKIKPIMLFKKSFYYWYIRAYCYLREDEREFRLSRIDIISIID